MSKQVKKSDVSAKKPTPPDRWQNLLLEVETKAGSYFKVCGANVSIILVHDSRWKDVLAYDELAGAIVFRKEPPWLAEDRIGKQSGTVWGDDDAVRLANWLARSKWELAVSSAIVQEVVSVVAKRNGFHPIKEWFDELSPWDGASRIDDWAIRLMGAEDTSVNRAICAKFLIGAVARVYEPGCKVDTVPIFEGEQGVGKSRSLRELCPLPEWFLETSIELGNKDSYQLLRGKWIVELAELDSLNRSELSRVKAYITSQNDTYRKSYGRISHTYPRMCIFAGTTNADEYLKDDTGARRFWPMKVSRVDIKGLRAEREQLWAEAVARYKKKERWHLTDRELLKEFEKVQETRRQVDPWEPIIARYFALGYDVVVDRYTNDKRHFSPPGKSVSMSTVLTGPLGLEPARITRTEQMRVSAILRKLGWERRRTYVGSEHAGYEYVRPDKETVKADAQDDKRARVIKLPEKGQSGRPSSTSKTTLDSHTPGKTPA